MKLFFDDKMNFLAGRVIASLIIILFLLILLLNFIVIVNVGERGVQTRFGAVTKLIYPEGLSFKLPFMEGVDIMDIKIQKISIEANAASKDLQVVTSTIALNYHINPDNVAFLRQSVGLDYKTKVIEPAIQEAVKASTAQFTAEELITKRPIVRETMKTVLQEKLNEVVGTSIIIDTFNIENFDFSQEFNTAIEAKVTAEQQALKAQRDLERIKIEKEQIITKAEAEAESIRIRSEAIKQNPQILQLEFINKWNGQLPQYLGGETGFLMNLPISEWKTPSTTTISISGVGGM